MNRPGSWQKILPPLILAVSLLAMYLRTMAPGLTWAHDGSDGGDLITAAATGGIPHPTGYPLYLLLARLFQYLPVGSLAFRTNVLSAVATVFAAVLVYGLVWSASTNAGENQDWLAGLAAGYAFGAAPLIWSQAVITEVYGLHGMLSALTVFLYVRPAPLSISSQKRLDSWRGLTLGLAIGNHISIVLLLPVALVLGCVNVGGQPGEVSAPWLSKMRWNQAALMRQLGMLVAGLSIYLIIPMRAMANPPVNWGNVVTPTRFWWLVSGQLYQDYYLAWNLPATWERLQAAAALLVQQFGMPGILLGLVGLILFGKPSRLFLLTGWMAVLFTVFAVVYRSNDSYVYLMPAFLAFAVWIGLGVIGLSNQFKRWSIPVKIVLSLLFMTYLVIQSITQFNRVDASTDTRAESFGGQVLRVAPEHALLFARGDRAIFALWYFHFALGERPDVSVVAEDLLHFDWYQENLRAVYPSLLVPGPFPWAETVALANPSRPVCYVQFVDVPAIDCSLPEDLECATDQCP